MWIVNEHLAIDLENSQVIAIEGFEEDGRSTYIRLLIGNKTFQRIKVEMDFESVLNSYQRELEKKTE